MLWTFYVTMGLTLVSGGYFYLKDKATVIYPLFSGVAFLVALASIISVISLYIYELPTHHCPFCIIMEDYQYIGYLLYILLFGAVVAGIGSGALLPFRELESLRDLLPSLIRRLTLVSVSLYFLFTSLVTYKIIFSNLIM